MKFDPCLAEAAGSPPEAQTQVRLRISPPGSLSVDRSDSGHELGYMIESRNSLSSTAPWLPAPASVWPVPGPTWTDPRGGRSPARFYRAVASPSAPERGKLLSVTRVGVLSPAEIVAGFALIDVPLVVRSGVVFDKLTYETINPFGLRTVASGLVVSPDQVTNSLALVSYQHGTITVRDEVASAVQGLDRLVGIALGTSGYVCAMSDYLGLGDSPGLHPYVHAQSLADAAIDMLRATRTFCATNGLPLSEQLFLVGYSEGGYATMALHRELEASYTNEFPVTASAPMAGPYDLSGTMVGDFLSDRRMESPYYFLYLLGAYQSIYQLGPSLADILLPPYDATLPPLLDGLHSGGELDRAMGTSIPTEILKPEFLHAFTADLNHPLRLALKENDLYDWTPKAPVRLFHCAGDQDVLPQNSKVAYDSFVRRGAAQVNLIDPMPTADHGGCAPGALFAAKAWFDTFLGPN